MQEIWMRIPKVADNYQVSNLGRVRNLKNPNQKTPKILNGHCKSTSGKPRAYCRLLLKTGEWKTFKHSWLVATVFIPNPKGYKNIAHINGDLTDDRACNLHWAKSQTIGVMLCRLRKELKAKKTNSKEIYDYWRMNNNDISATAEHYKINCYQVEMAIQNEMKMIRNKRNEAIIYEVSKGKSQAEVARKYKLSEAVISRIIRGER